MRREHLRPGGDGLAIGATIVVHGAFGTSTPAIWLRAMTEDLPAERWWGEIRFSTAPGLPTSNTILVPVKVTFAIGRIPEPSSIPSKPIPLACQIASLPPLDPHPAVTDISRSTDFIMNGVLEPNTQYVDAFQRANFFDAVELTGDSYHTVLNLKNTVSSICDYRTEPPVRAFDTSARCSDAARSGSSTSTPSKDRGERP